MGGSTAFNKSRRVETCSRLRAASASLAGKFLRQKWIITRTLLASYSFFKWVKLNKFFFVLKITCWPNSIGLSEQRCLYVCWSREEKLRAFLATPGDTHRAGILRSSFINKTGHHILWRLMAIIKHVICRSQRGAVLILWNSIYMPDKECQIGKRQIKESFYF